MGTGCIASGMGIISGCCTETSSLGSREGGSPVGGELQHRFKGIQGRVGDLGHTLEMGPSRFTNRLCGMRDVVKSTVTSTTHLYTSQSLTI